MLLDAWGATAGLVVTGALSLAAFVAFVALRK
jgi:hypothetical protein